MAKSMVSSCAWSSSLQVSSSSSSSSVAFSRTGRRRHTICSPQEKEKRRALFLGCKSDKAEERRSRSRVKLRSVSFDKQESELEGSNADVVDGLVGAKGVVQLYRTPHLSADALQGNKRETRERERDETRSDNKKERMKSFFFSSLLLT